jgi:hypothetical protein
MPNIDSNAALDELNKALEPARRPKINYTHADLVDFIIANPGISQNALAARYGYSPGWMSQMLASDALQELLAARRKEIVNPELLASLEERFRGLTIQSLEVLKKKLEQPAVEASVALRCAELGAKSLGVGLNRLVPPTSPSGDPLEHLANRLISLTNQQGAINGESTRVPEKG